MYGMLKKKFGQNFLIDKNILNKISILIEKKNLKIIEIGPGDGRLTENIINYSPRKLKLIEIDDDLIPLLRKKFNSNSNVEIINEDILSYNIDEKVDLIISNLPYNISSQILVKICLLRYLPPMLLLMFQKEFAQRLLEKKLNSLNSLVGCFFKVKSNFIVSRNSFRPIPKVDSIVLSFSRKQEILLRNDEIERFIKFKQILFSHKRKTLNNLLKNFEFQKSKYDLTKRVEDISLQQLIKIFRESSL